MAILKRPVSPRQKMINLMYIVLLAMLALNISPEILNGFSVVEDSLDRSANNSSKVNKSIYDDFVEQMKTNPDKVKVWFSKATQVKNMSDSLYNFAQLLKEEIVKAADGEQGNLKQVKNPDDLEAASTVMLAPVSGKGRQLYDAINQYRARILSMVSDPQQREIISGNLTTEVPKGAATMGKNWQEYLFENIPVAAAITLLTKLQSDVRYAEGEVLHTLVANIDMKDVRVNKLSAFVIPESRTVISGDQYSAQILMAAVDTTQQPQIFVGGRRISGNNYRFAAGSVGEHSFGGYIMMHDRSGRTIRRDFTTKYNVVAPSATVSADLMNVLYAGYDNGVSISIPGVPLNAVQASMTGGSFRNIGLGKYIAKPVSVGKDVTITVSSSQNGRTRQMGKFVFHVRKLPDPIAFIQVGDDRFKGGGLTKSSLMGASGIRAAIDDGLLDIPFRVTGFETVFFDSMGNAVPMASSGADFSDRQRQTFRSLSRNRRFYITNVSAVGPDGLSRKLPGALEVIVK